MIAAVLDLVVHETKAVSGPINVSKNSICISSARFDSVVNTVVYEVNPLDEVWF